MDEQPSALPEQPRPETDLPRQTETTARYVLASGPNMGESVEVYLIGSPRKIGDDIFQDLGRVTNLQLDPEPGVDWQATIGTFQSMARYSDGKEPGTWHYV